MDYHVTQYREDRLVKVQILVNGEGVEALSLICHRDNAEQFEAAYRELVAAVDAISEKESIDLVFRFAPTAEAFDAKGSGEAIMKIRERTFLKYPTQIDITEDVLKALNVG